MTRVMQTGVAVLTVVTMAMTAACSKQESRANSNPASTGVELTFRSNPEAPKMGENAFDVMVMRGGKPVDDAQVSVEFQMPAMPQMNMSEMKTKTDLMPMGNGKYQGKGQVMMAGNWNVTVMAMKGGQEIGSKMLTVTAK